MIETYKILSGKCDSAAIPILTTSPTLTRGNDLRLQTKIVQDMIFANFFTNRIVNVWNISLPNDVVHAESTNTFKL